MAETDGFTCTPVKFGYDTNLWTGTVLAELLKQEFGVTVSDSTVRLHLKALGLICQKPEYQDVQRNEQEIEHFLNDKFPRIRRLADKIGADIGFEDEAGVGVMCQILNMPLVMYLNQFRHLYK